jgi:hypothetical protein
LLDEQPETVHSISIPLIPLVLVVIALGLIGWGIWRLLPKDTSSPAELSVEMLDLERPSSTNPAASESTLTDDPSSIIAGENLSPAVTATPRPTATPTARNSATPTPTPVSTVTTTPANATINGTVTLLGYVPSGSSILVLYRLPGANDYQVISRLEAKNGVSWQWTGAKPGQNYDLKLAFQVNNQNRTTSSNAFVTAPATVNFSLYTGEGSSSVTVNNTTPNVPRLESCGNKENNRWRAKLVLPKVDNAKQYWLTVGTDYNGNNHLDQHYTGSDQQTIWLDLEDGRDYYAKYAVRNCSDCSDNFGPFSATLKFKCSGSSASYSGRYGDFKGFKCNKDAKSCESTHDSNPPYPNTEEGLDRCLREC